MMLWTRRPEVSRGSKSVMCLWSPLLFVVLIRQSCVAATDLAATSMVKTDLQVMAGDRAEVAQRNHTILSSYEQELAKCSYVDKKLLLSLVLRSHSWDEVISQKQQRAIQKLSKMFAIPKEYMNLFNVNQRNLHEMAKATVRQGVNDADTMKKLGKLELVIGCGNAYFDSGKRMVSEIEQAMSDGTINDISGLDFGWWLIWSQPFNVNNRVPRYRRDAVLPQESSGGDDYDESYYDDDDDNDDVTNTEVPIAMTGEHPHRHHHGSDALPIRDILTNKVVSTAVRDKNRLKSGSSDLDADIKESVSKLESDISKTIENNNEKLIEVEQEIEQLLHAKNAHVSTLVEAVHDDEIGIEIASKKPVVESAVVEDVLVANNDDVKVAMTTTMLSSLETEASTMKWSDIATETVTPSTTSASVIVTPTERPDLDVSVVTTMSSATTTKTDSAESTTATITTTTTTTTTTTPKATTAKETPVTTIESIRELSTFAVSTSTETVTITDRLTSPADLPSSSSSTTTSSLLVGTTAERKLSVVGLATTTVAAVTAAHDEDEPDYELTDEFKAKNNKTTEASAIEKLIVPSSTTTVRTTTNRPTTTEFVEPEPANYAPSIRNRFPKQAVTAGKSFSFVVPLETFHDTEDGSNLRLQLLDKNDHKLEPNSWIQFNADTREVYGLPLEDAVSKWQFKLRATDSWNETVTETLDISVQQHKSHRSANHEISVGIKLNEKYGSNVDWQIRLIRGIAETLGDNSLASIMVREIRHNQQDSHTLIYTNDTLPKDKCPEEKLEDLFQRLTAKSLSEIVQPEMSVKFVNGKPIGPCAKADLPKPKAAKPTPHMTKNFPPVPRNQVDRVNATIGQLLVFKVPVDTFYDPEDNTDLKLSLLNMERTQLDPKHWLQFDAKNQEFYGIPKYGDSGQREYLLVAEDREGLTATDALVVVVNHPTHREYNNMFEMTLGMDYEDFNNSAVQRRFVERIAAIFGDVSATGNVQIRSIRKIHPSGKTMISYYNSTLHRPHRICPSDSIEQLKRVLVHPDGSIRTRVKDTLGAEFDLNLVNLVPVGACLETSDGIHHAMIPIGKPDDSTPASGFKDDYLLTFVLPAVIIIAMLSLATIVACVLHRRRITGKMELGDEEERRSFRSKGIPVIFQDELDEKPEIGNKSPIILKDEKPPLLPPSYNTNNPDDNMTEEDMDEYVPPPAVVMNGRESRGKSPVTPSYRKPPPYVSP